MKWDQPEDAIKKSPDFLVVFLCMIFFRKMVNTFLINHWCRESKYEKICETYQIIRKFAKDTYTMNKI